MDNHYMRQLASGIINHKDKLYLEAIQFVSKGELWSINEIKSRCLIEIIATTQIEIFIIDGTPMIEFYPPEYNQTTEDLCFKINSVIRYRKLYEEKQK